MPRARQVRLGELLVIQRRRHETRVQRLPNGHQVFQTVLANLFRLVIISQLGNVAVRLLWILVVLGNKGRAWSTSGGIHHSDT